MAEGLIAAALGGFGKALSSIGEMEAKKQNEAKLRKEIMDMESEERLRLDEVMHQRKLERMPGEAIVQAKSTAGAEAAGIKERSDLGVPQLKANYDVSTESARLDAEEKAGLPAKRAAAKVSGEKADITAASEANLPEARAELKSRETKAQLQSDMDKGVLGAQATYKVMQRIEELKAADVNKLSEAEAKAKYDALKADIDEAKRTKYWDSYYEQEANKKLSELDAIIKAKVPEAEARVEATKRKEVANALVKEGTLTAEANADAQKRLESVRAQLDKNIPKLEADLFARQELAKVQAMTAQGVPEAEAKLLAAKWRAQKTQRDEAAAEKTQNEMNDLITKMGNKPYTNALKKQETISATSGLILQANRDAKEKKDRERNTIEMERQIKETEKEMGRILGIGDPKKIPDEINYLESQAKKGNSDAVAKLEKIEPLSNELNSLSRELRSYKRGSSDRSNQTEEKTTYKKGDTQIIPSGPNKGKTAVFDGIGWKLKE